MFRYLTLMAIALIALTSCCAITSVQPLESDTPAYHKQLTGVWIHQAEGGHVILHLGRTKNNRIQVLGVEYEKDGTFVHDSFTLSGIKLNAHHYLNLDMQAIPEKHREGHSGHIILHYNFPDRDTLVFSLLKRDPTLAAVQAKKLAGEITYNQIMIGTKAPEPAPDKDRKPDCVRITATTKSLKHFIAGSDPAKLFAPEITFKRMK